MGDNSSVITKIHPYLRRILGSLLILIIICISFYSINNKTDFYNHSSEKKTTNRQLSSSSSSSSSSSKSCNVKKKLVLDLGNYGIGNRMLAIASASIFATMSDRILELKWERTGSCRQSFTELFVPKEPAGEFSVKPFVYEGLRDLSTVKIQEKACHVHINEEEVISSISSSFQ